jgi:hypothetical protein
MHDDELIDQLLRTVMTGDVPQLSPGFDSRVMRRVRPRRLTPIGRTVLVAYIAVAAATAVFLMRDLDMTSIVAAVAISVPIAAGASIYGQRVAVGR